MNWDAATKIFQQIQTLARGDAILHELERKLVEAAVRYARIRVDWQLSDLERRRAMDRPRIMAHDALIDACNILSRTMKSQGKDISWRAQLGQTRQEIGDFACYVHCFVGLSAR